MEAKTASVSDSFRAVLSVVGFGKKCSLHLALSDQNVRSFDANWKIDYVLLLKVYRLSIVTVCSPLADGRPIPFPSFFSLLLLVRSSLVLVRTEFWRVIHPIHRLMREAEHAATSLHFD